MKPAVELVAPLIAEPGRREDEDAIRQTSRPKFRDQQTCLYRLSESDVVGEQDTATVASKDGDGRLELMRQHVDVRGGCRPQEARRGISRDERACGTPPPRGSHATQRRWRRGHRVKGIKRRQQFTTVSGVCSRPCERDETTRIVRSNVDYLPGAAAGADDVAGVKNLHAKAPSSCSN
jgi:hypothetical protein